MGGLLTQISNPKALLFFASILPQFVDPRGNVIGQLIILGIASLVVEASVLSMYSFTARRLVAVGAGNSTALWFERIGGAMMLGIAARVAE